MAKFVLSMDGCLIDEFPIDKNRLTVGRRPSNDIHIDNLAVSGEHAVIMTIGNDSFLEDIGSTNGTLVNGKIIKKHVLQHGDVLEFGKFELKYINEAAVLQAQNGGMDDFEKSMIIRPAAKAVTINQALAAPSHTSLEKNLNPVKLEVTQTLLSVTSTTLPPALNQAMTIAPIAKPAAATVDSLATISNASINSEVKASQAVGHIQVLTGASAGKELMLNKTLTTLGKSGVQVAVITKRPQGYFITHVEGAAHPIVNGQSAGAQAHQLNDNDVIVLAGVKMQFYLFKAA